MAVTLEFFPRARFDRAAPGGVAAFPSGGTGGVELISFHVQSTGVARSSRSSQLLAGPALLDEVRLLYSATSLPPNAVFELGLGLAEVLEVNVLVTTVKPYRSLFTHVQRATPALNPAIQGGFLNMSGAATWVSEVFRLGIPIWNPEFRLVFAVIMPDLAAHHASGHVVVRTGLDPELLRNFL